MSIVERPKRHNRASRETNADREPFELQEQNDVNKNIISDDQAISNRTEDEQSQQPLTRQRKKHGHKRKRRGATNHTDVDNQHILSTLDGENVDNQQEAARSDVQLNNDSTITFDDSNTNRNEKEANDEKDGIVSLNDLNVEKTEKPTEIINDLTKDIDLLAGYAAEPLLTLVEACAPLENILHDLSTYVQMALTETPSEPPDGLTVDESAAIRLYTIEWEPPHRSLYSMLNYTLKTTDRENIHHYFRYLKLFLTAMVKIPCSPPTIVWRGVTKNLSAEFPPGTPVIWWAVTSCTVELTVLENQMYLGNTGARTLFSVESINGRSVRPHSHFVTEEELLLLPGTYMEVQSLFTPAPDLYIIHLKQMKPTVPLLEPPFEGAHIYPPEKKKTPWYKKKRNILQLSLLVILCIAGLIVGVVLATRPPAPPYICTPPKYQLRADLFWSFDCSDSREDLTGLYNGTNKYNVQYSSPDFSGKGKALVLSSDTNPYVLLPSLAIGGNRSFTLSLWFFLTTYTAQTLFTSCNTFDSVCIAFVINGKSFFIFDINLSDPTSVDWVYASLEAVYCQLCWMYMSFSYDNQTQSISFYINGQPMNLTNDSPQILNDLSVKNNGSHVSYIGINPVDFSDHFSGLIDHMSILYAVKNASEILDEATRLCHYEFDSDDVNYDSSTYNIQAQSAYVYRMTSNITNTSYLLFNSSASNFQSSGFTLLKSNSYAFSFAFWFRVTFMPVNVTDELIPLLQVAAKVVESSSETYACILTLYIDASTRLMSFFIPQILFTVHINPIGMLNTSWNHLALTYINGTKFNIYFNGRLNSYISDTRFSTMLFSNPRLTVTIGSGYSNDTEPTGSVNYDANQCFQQIPNYDPIPLNGQMDDFVFFARNLNDAEVKTLYQNSRNSTGFS